MKKLLAAVVLMAAAVTGAYAQTDKDKMTIATGVDPSLGTFYVAKVGGFFDKNGLDVQLDTGPSGSAMVPLLIKNQVQAVLAAEQAGIVNFNVDPDIVVTSQMMMMLRYYGVVGRNIDDLDGLKGKTIGMTPGGAGELFWRALVTKLNLNAADYNIAPVESPEMIAALERGNLDAVATWEPWISRTLQSVSGTKLLRDNEGIISTRNFLYVNRSWAEANPDVAVRFMRALVEATDFIRTNPDEAAKQIAGLLNLDADFTKGLIEKVEFDMRLDQAAVDYLKTIEAQLKDVGRLTKPVDWDRYIYPDIAEKAMPEKVDLAR